VQQNSNSYIEGSSLESYFGQVNYDYKTLILSGTVRRDGSSKFINNKWELSALSDIMDCI
jgi:hypothetical protein